MYCIKCGVIMDDGEKKCPLCNTLVCHPDFIKNQSEKLYPANKLPKATSGLKALSGAIIILFLIPLIISLYSDLHSDGRIDWSGYIMGALIVSYTSFALPLWFKKPNPVIFVPCSFGALALYLMYINFATGGDWYLTFALPVVSGLCLIISSIITLLYYIKRGHLYVFGGAFMLTGGYLLMMEYLLSITFNISFIGWSIYPLIVLVLFGGMLIYLAINGDAREMIERKFFF